MRDLLPGKYGHYIASITGAFSMFTVGQSFAWPSVALAKMLSGDAGFYLTPEETTWMVTLAYIGNTISPIPAGFIMDKIGRKMTLLISCLLFLLSWIGLMSSNPYSIWGARFLQGVWVGIAFTVIPVFVGEVADAKTRGRMTTICGLMFSTGCALETIMGIGSFKTLAWLSIVPSVILFFSYLFIPETPYFYLMIGEKQKAKSSILWLRGICDENELNNLEINVQEQIKRTGTFFDLVRTKVNRKAFIMVEILCLLQRCSGLTLLLSYLSLIIPDSFMPREYMFLILCLSYIIGGFISSFVVDRLGRILAFRASCVGTGCAMTCFSVWFYLRDMTSVDMGNKEWMLAVFIVLKAISYGFGLVTVPQIIQGEIYSVSVKARGSSLASMTSALTSAFTLGLFLPLTTHFGLYSNFVICAGSCSLGFIYSFIGMVETKGKTLEEIQEMLENKKI